MLSDKTTTAEIMMSDKTKSTEIMSFCYIDEFYLLVLVYHIDNEEGFVSSF